MSANSSWGDLIGGLVKHAITEVAQVVKEEVKPIVQALEAELRQKAEEASLAGSETVTQDAVTQVHAPSKDVTVQPAVTVVQGTVAGQPATVTIEAPPAVTITGTLHNAEPWTLSPLDACDGFPDDYWTEPPFSQDKDAHIKWLSRMVAMCIGNWQTAINEVRIPDLTRSQGWKHEPMTPHEAAFSFGIVFASYVHKAGAGNSQEIVNCAIALKRWFDQGVKFYEQQLEAQRPAGPLSGGA